MFGIKTFKHLGRLRQITAIVMRHGLGHYLERRRQRLEGEELTPDLSSGRYPRLDERPPGPPGNEHSIPTSATHFRAILEELGPTFIKFGQILSTRSDLLPASFITALSGLQDDCPPMTAGQLQVALQKGLHKPVGEIFKYFAETPIASASIAEVHLGVLHSGEEVAVKVQRVGIQELIVKDLDLLEYLAELAESIIEESGLVAPKALLQEFEQALVLELDFTHEALMMEKFHANLQERQDAGYVVPKVYREFSSPTVLVMEFIKGQRLADFMAEVQAGQVPEEIRQKVVTEMVNTAFAQIFVDGLFHADPHPGNIFLLADQRLALIDFGAVGQISYAMRETLVGLVIAMGLQDADTVARLLYKVCIPEARISLASLRDAVAALFAEYLHGKQSLQVLMAKEGTQLLKQLFALAARFHLHIPSEYALVARSAVAVEGIIRSLDPQLEVLNLRSSFMQRLLNEQFKFTEVKDQLLRGMFQTRDVLKDLPISAMQILMDLQAGKLQVHIENKKLDSMARSLDTLHVSLFISAIAGGLIVSSLMLLAHLRLELWGMPAVPLVALIIASLFFMQVIRRYFIVSKMYKISLRRLFKRKPYKSILDK